jgi:hypothetical protein
VWRWDPEAQAPVMGSGNGDRCCSYKCRNGQQATTRRDIIFVMTCLLTVSPQWHDVLRDRTTVGIDRTTFLYNWMA